MDKIISLIKKNWVYLTGGIAGGTGGYLYWYYVGCSTGVCPITASPVMSIIWGALFGGILFGSVFIKKKDEK